MKRIFTFLFATALAAALLLFPTSTAAPADPATSASWRLLWDASPASEGITDYVVYERTLQPGAPPVYVSVGISPTTEFILPQLTPGLHTFVVTARSGAQESPPSNAVDILGALTAPGNVRAVLTITIPPQ